MSNFENPFKDFVFSLPEDKLDLLIECINNRKDYDLYGVTNLEDAAVKYGRKPMCPKCSCEIYIEQLNKSSGKYTTVVKKHRF